MSNVSYQDVVFILLLFAAGLIVFVGGIYMAVGTWPAVAAFGFCLVLAAVAMPSWN